MSIVDFGNWVNSECNMAYPSAQFTDWGDPAGENKYSKADGGFTSNADLLRKECGINIMPSEQNWEVRKESVEKQLGKVDGLLIDPSCIRLINGFIGGYCYPQVGQSGRYADKPDKNRFADVHEALQYAMLKLVGSQRRSDLSSRMATDFDVMAANYGAKKWEVDGGRVENWGGP